MERIASILLKTASVSVGFILFGLEFSASWLSYIRASVEHIGVWLDGSGQLQIILPNSYDECVCVHIFPDTNNYQDQLRNMISCRTIKFTMRWMTKGVVAKLHLNLRLIERDVDWLSICTRMRIAAASDQIVHQWVNGVINLKSIDILTQCFHFIFVQTNLCPSMKAGCQSNVPLHIWEGKHNRGTNIWMANDRVRSEKVGCRDKWI